MAQWFLSVLLPCIPLRGKSGTKQGCYKRIDAALKRNFEASSQGFRASMANSIFSRAAYIWAEELAASEKSLSIRAKSTLKKIALAAAAFADCASHTLDLSARAMTTGVMAHTHKNKFQTAI